MTVATVSLRRAPTRTQVLRRRRVVAVFLLAFVFALCISAGQVLANRGGAPASTPTVRPATTYVVQPGDTLWAIARRLQPTGDIRPLVDELARRAGSAAVVAGQRLDLSGLPD